jgi:hypothetical protein
MPGFSIPLSSLAVSCNLETARTQSFVLGSSGSVKSRAVGTEMETPGVDGRRHSQASFALAAMTHYCFSLPHRVSNSVGLGGEGSTSNSTTTD